MTTPVSTPETPTRQPGARVLKQQTIAMSVTPPRQPLTTDASSGLSKQTHTASRSSPHRTPSPSPRSSSSLLREPYDQYSYNVLREEWVRRGVPLRRPPRSRGRCPKQAYVNSLREADMLEKSGNKQGATSRLTMKVAARVNLKKPSATTTSPAVTKVARARPPPISTADEVSSVGPESPPSSSKSSSRSRRGCRFRLINILFSPEFSSRWDEMRDAPTSESDEANVFWRSVHTAFLSEPSSYGQLQLDDELFANVNPALVVLHTAQKLQQMWQEMTCMYRRAVNSSYADFKSNRSKLKPFFHYCAGRLDLLYIHMGLLLAPKLVESVVNNPRKALFVLNHTNPTAPTSASETKRVVKSGKQLSPGQRSEDRRGSGAGTFVNEVIPKTPKLVELQNPELLPDWLIEDQAKTAAARGDFVPASLVGESVRKNPRAQKKSKASQMISSSVSPIFASPSSISVDPPVETTDLVLHSSAINSIDEGYISSDYEAGGGYQFSRKPAPKRRRQESTEIVEFPMTHELVPHSHKRMHTAVTTTMTRSQEVTLPPDEFDVLHNRLRKMNECIDECYRTLSSPDGILNEMHRQDVEGDLQFYTSIKKRIQQQLMMAMSGF